MTVVAFIGKPRTGKTLGMTMLAEEDYRLRKHEIFSNYHLSFPHTRLEVNKMLQIPLTDVDRHPKTLCIQEADKVFDSRRSMRNENVLLSSLTGQSGKRNLNIYFDTQFWARIDKSLRDVTEIIFTCSAYMANKTPIAFQYNIIDVYEYQTNPNYEPKEVIIPITIMKKYFSMYDSYQTTDPLVKSSKMSEILEIEQT